MEHVVGLGDPERLRALQRTAPRDNPVDESFDRLTRLLTLQLGVPVALLSLVDDQPPVFTGQPGVLQPWAARRGIPLSHSFCQYVVATDQPMTVEDSRTDPRVPDDLAGEDLDVIAYAGAPVRALDGRPLGALCAIDTVPRAWTSAETTFVQELAEVAGELVALRTAAVATRATVLELSHQLRTHLTALSLEAASVTDPAAAALRDGLSKLSDVATATLRTLAQPLRGADGAVSVDDVLAGVVSRHADRERVVVAEPAPRLTVSAPPGELGAVLDGLVEVLLASGRGTVTLSASATAGFVRLRVLDESAGLPDHVVRRVLTRADHADALVTDSLAERSTTALGGRLVLASATPTTFELLLPQG